LNLIKTYDLINLMKDNSSGFSIEPAQLSKLFEPDNIREHESLKIVKNKFSGIDGLFRSLHSSVKTGISGSSADVEARKVHFGRNDPP
jgi:hypothetical protein